MHGGPMPACMPSVQVRLRALASPPTSLPYGLCNCSPICIPLAPQALAATPVEHPLPLKHAHAQHMFVNIHHPPKTGPTGTVQQRQRRARAVQPRRVPQASAALRPPRPEPRVRDQPLQARGRASPRINVAVAVPPTPNPSAWHAMAVRAAGPRPLPPQRVPTRGRITRHLMQMALTTIS